MLRNDFSLFIFIPIFFSLVACSTFERKDYELQNAITYKQIDGLSLKGDLYISKKEGLRPAIVVVHGGSWKRRAGDIEWICRDLANAGYVVFNVTYRFAPQHQFPKPVEDIRDAVLWLKQNASKYNVDPEKMAGWGYSAGSNLILLAAIDGTLGLKAVVAGGTPANLTVWPKSPMVKEYLGSLYAENPKVWEAASPTFLITESSPPVFLYHGSWDDLVEPNQMEMMADALKQKQRVVETYSVPLMGHMMVYLLSQSSVDHGIDFLKRHNL